MTKRHKNGSHAKQVIMVTIERTEILPLELVGKINEAFTEKRLKVLSVIANHKRYSFEGDK